MQTPFSQVLSHIPEDIVANITGETLPTQTPFDSTPEEATSQKDGLMNETGQTVGATLEVNEILPKAESGSFEPGIASQLINGPNEPNEPDVLSEADTSPFNPEIHLSPYFEPPAYITMSELGFKVSDDAEEIAATKPFPLLTVEGVRRIREELFSEKVLSNHLFSDTLNPSTIRGCCPEAAPFTYQFWRDPEVQRRINEAAGTELTIVFDYEIGHTNLQLGPRGWSGLKADPDLPDASGELANEKEIDPTLMKTPNWHKDSYPFVCILMLCESSHLEGGRTVIRKPDGTNYFCELPPLGYAMVLQGGHILHAVSPTNKTQERISMVTSYRPSNPLKKDISILKTIRTMSDVSILHRQWCQYRLDVLSKRAQHLKDQLGDPEFKGSTEEEMGKFMLQQGEFLADTWGEMIKPVGSVKTTSLSESYFSWLSAKRIPMVQ